VHRTKVLVFLLLICLTVLLYSQEQEEEDPITEPDRDYSYLRSVPGDQAIIISAGTIFPVLFVYSDQDMENKPDWGNFKPPVGGNLYLSYNYFLTPNFFVGGEVSFIFISTLGLNSAYFVPLGARIGYQFYLWRFEFPLSLSIGMAWHRYLDFGYYGFYAKAGASAYFRFNEDWSFGLNSAFGWYPEWIFEEPKKNVDGFIVDLTLSVRYHF